MNGRDIELIGDFLESADYLGTGSSSKDADEERNEILDAWSRIVMQLTLSDMFREQGQ
jgi:hypothetical protein